MIVEANLSTITALAVDGRGSLWAGTPGGLVEWPKGGEARPRRHGRAEGVPGLRVTRLGVSNGSLVVEAEGRAKFSGGRFLSTKERSSSTMWSLEEVKSLPGPPLAKAVWKGKAIFAIPESGLWSVAGGKASPFAPQPTNLQLSSVVARGADLYVGTGSQGVWKLTGGKWSRLAQPKGELKGSDVVSLIPLGEQVLLSPREGPSYLRSGSRVQSAGAPWRQSVEWQGQTVVRRADGLVFLVDAQGKQTLFPHKLPRVSATSLAVQAETLFIAQPGGWSSFDREGASHHFDLPQLQGCPTTAILSDEQRVWIGTQNAGLVEFNRSTREAKGYHEVHGLTDDWVTALAKDAEGHLLVGTYVGGLHVLEKGRLRQVGLKGGFVTRLLPVGDKVWVGSLTGMRVWAKGVLASPKWNSKIEPDVTDLALQGNELWIASGGALHRVLIP